MDRPRETPVSGAGQFALTPLPAATASVALPPAAAAQYFGRNKVQYGSFDFEVLKTDHFDVYHYPAERAAAEQAGRPAGRWDRRPSKGRDHRRAVRPPRVPVADPPELRATK